MRLAFRAVLGAPGPLLLALLVITSALTGCGGGGGEAEVGITISWVPPVSYMNGDDLPPEEIGGFKVYYHLAGDPTVMVMDVSNITFKEFFGLKAGEWLFTVSCYDLYGNESPPSVEIPVTVS